MNDPTHVDIAVVGKGLIGAATARHLGELSAGTDRRIAIIGPDEPESHETWAGPFASHFDQGRITNVMSSDPVWAELSSRSIRRYGDIEHRSRISFHTPRSLVVISPTAAQSVAAALAHGNDARMVSADWLTQTTGIVAPAGSENNIAVEGPPAGFINPRRLLAAQTLLARQAGVLVANEAAQEIAPTPGGYEITTAAQRITADRIVLATGAYGTSLMGRTVELQRRLRTILLADLGPGPEIPSASIDSPGHDALEEIYWVPPVEFADGRTMLKIGGNSLPMICADSNSDIDRWFRTGGSVAEAQALLQVLMQLLPSAAVSSWSHKPCVVAYTPTELPYIGMVEENLLCALGGSGSAAKSSDELGRLAATLSLSGEWTDPDLDASTFAPRFAE